ncbi:MAG: uroporphyrinogen decarboxylase family protein [Candidatus Latescibacterota bacterium]
MKESLALIDQSCRGIRPARIPIFDVLQNDAVVAHYSGMKLDGTDDAQAMILAAGAALDGTRHVAPPYPEGYTRTDRTGNTHEGARWTMWLKTHAFTSPEQWTAWLPDHIAWLESRPPTTLEEKEAERQRQLGLNRRLNGSMFIHCTPLTAINNILFGYHCGLDTFPYLWMDERPLVLRWMRALRKDTLRGIEFWAHKDTGPLAMIYSDVAYHQKLMFAPETMREMGFFDDVAAICDRCHQKGVAVIFHSDGYVMEILDDLIAAGIDGLNPLEKAAGMDIYEVRRKHPELILVGGVDVSHLMPFGTAAEVRRETRRIIDGIGAQGRFLIGSTTEIGDDIPLSNYLAFHDEAMKG